MQKLVIIIGMVLISGQVWGASTEERSTLIRCDGATRQVTEYQEMASISIRQNREFKALGIPHTVELNKKEIEESEKNIVTHCGKLDTFIKAAAEGNDKVYDNLMSAFDEFVTDKNLGANAKKYQRKLEMAQQRALLKAKQAEVNTATPPTK